ncbi:MAG: hypothetical protein NTU63_04075 [Candidatus Pacearchaeota archaeon]|nr:hypothetical protein [Candidatus Pacearchaeota archaeon]
MQIQGIYIMEEYKILEERENPIFKRKELKISIMSNVAPKIQEVESFLSEKLSTQQENIKIKKIKGRFGSYNFVIFANVYASKEDKEKTEPKSKKEKNKAEKKGEQK